VFDMISAVASHISCNSCWYILSFPVSLWRGSLNHMKSLSETCRTTLGYKYDPKYHVWYKTKLPLRVCEL